MTHAVSGEDVEAALAILDETEEVGDGVVLRRASSVLATAPEWLWRPRIALGSITLLVGTPGLGKTLLACWVAARATQGELDGGPRGGVNVLIASAEDSIEHTLVPRLIAAGADLDRVYFLGVRRKGVEEGIVLPDDIANIDLAVADRRAKLLVIDPLMAHLSSDSDSHHDQSIRTALAPLYRTADINMCAVVLLSHLNKRPENDLFSRVGGSIGLTGAARNVLLMTPDPDAPEDEAARVLVHGKANLGAPSPTLRMRIEPDESVAGGDGQPISTAVIEIGEAAPHLHVTDVLRTPDTDEERSEIDEAMDYLAQALGDGPRPSLEIMREGKRLGHAERTLKRARARLRVTAQKSGLTGGWSVQLPEESHANGANGLQRGTERRGRGGPSPFRRGEGPPWPSSSVTGKSVNKSSPTTGTLPEDDSQCAQGCGRSVGRPGVTCAQCAITEA